MLTLDTSGLLAALNARDPRHVEAIAALRDDGGPFVIPAGILAEATYMIEKRLGAEVLDAFLDDVEHEAFTPDWQAGDLSRIRALTRHYRGFPLGFADAAVAACAERHGGRVLTYDLRHVSAVAREGMIRVVGFEGE